MLKQIKKYAICLLTAIMAISGSALFSSCDSVVYDDLDPCPLTLRFIYDYNMEFANAFPSQVDCLTVFFFDKEGKYVAARTNDSRSELGDESYRMRVELAPGEYTVVAYGGMFCDKSTFHFSKDPSTLTLQSLEVALNDEAVASTEKGTDLHPLFYGKIDVVVDAHSKGYHEYTVPMMKDTNNLRVVLQQIDGDPLDNADFDFRVIDDNTYFGWDNDLISKGLTTYLPWARDNASPGELPGGGISQVCYAEMSFPRLMTKNSPRLQITRRSDGYRVVDIPLIPYLLLLRSEAYKDMDKQEFLDRESRWDMIFFLDRNHVWLQTQMIINDWVVRLEDIDFN